MIPGQSNGRYTRGQRRSADTFVQATRALRYLEIDGWLLRTNGEHPFWVSGQGWTPADSLVPGDVLVTINGERRTVLSTAPVAEATEVFDIEVDRLLAFSVGELATLVHNK